jgi:hypothetical protein
MELKPCPFCGGPACEPENISKGRPIWQIQCSSFCCSIKWDSKKEAIRIWNTRTAPDLSRVEELLKTYVDIVVQHERPGLHPILGCMIEVKMEEAKAMLLREIKGGE